MGQKL
jgi:hypothetical protein